ncbi:MAG TPA: phosphatidylglycerol lysyltransferase domain-containing protein [Patescibacteria group bacterium]|nr:phosphatidylglycerol lysyltransferase domain-containing protein [Patescibacteria group bacterium]
MFKTFPEFSKLTLDDKAEYEALIKSFPPIADFSFATMMSWWNPLNSLGISLLNDNLVIPYWIPGDDTYSGLSLVGTNKVDESICTIFDYLRARGDPPVLVNVPELVIHNVQYPELFNFKEERPSFDYILPTSKYFPLENVNGFRRAKIRKQLHQLAGVPVEVRPLHLSSLEDRDFLLAAADKWWNKNLSSIGSVERESMETCIREADKLGISNICLFVDGKLQGFCLFQYPSSDKEYVIINHIKATHKKRLSFELMAHLFAEYFTERGIEYVNINSDVGILRLRMFMLTLGPTNFFRKYRIEPA